MVDVVCKYGNDLAFYNRLRALQLEVHEAEEGETLKAEGRIERVNTPTLTDINGDMYLTFRCTQKQADKIPSQGNNPAFTMIWRSDELDETDPENPVPYPWPEAEVNAYDENGVVSGTRMQGVGRIA